MNQLINQNNRSNSGGNAQPQIILINVAVISTNSELTIQANIDPEIPFNQFINGIKEQIFAQKFEVKYEETIEYQLLGSNIQQTEVRTLSQLGFTNNCKMYVRLKLKGG